MNSVFRIPSLLALFVLVGVGASQAMAGPEQPLRIGMVHTLFTGVPKVLAGCMTQGMAVLIKEQSGLPGDPVISGDAFEVGRLLQEGKYQLGIFQGVEFGWAQQRYPGLRPLMLAVNKHRKLHGNLVVSRESQAADFAALKGKRLGLARSSKAHVLSFIDRNCAACGSKNARELFHISRLDSVEDALDAILLDNIDAAVVDDWGIDYYSYDKPGCFKRLKVVQQSQGFPPGVIAYHTGALDKAVREQLVSGMVKAHEDVAARELMSLMHITAFETVPADFGDALAKTVRLHPRPQEGKATALTLTP